MIGWHRLMPLASVVDRFSQTKYRRITTALLTRSGISIQGTPLWVSPRTYFDISCPGAISLGDGCVVSHYVSFLTHDFSMDRAAVHIRGDQPDDKEYYRSAPISVGENAFIGLRAIILPGINVGSGAIVGAGAVVTKDVPENGIVGGNPARLIGYTTDNLDARLADFSLGYRRP